MLDVFVFESTPNKTCRRCHENDERPSGMNTTNWTGRWWNLKIKVIPVLILHKLHGYCRREITMRIASAKEAFSRKMSLLTSKLNIELKKKLVRCYVWSISVWLRDMDTKKIEAEVFGELWNVVLEENGEDKMVRESN